MFSGLPDAVRPRQTKGDDSKGSTQPRAETTLV